MNEHIVAPSTFDPGVLGESPKSVLSIVHGGVASGDSVQVLLVVIHIVFEFFFAAETKDYKDLYRTLEEQWLCIYHIPWKSNKNNVLVQLVYEFPAFFKGLSSILKGNPPFVV